MKRFIRICVVSAALALTGTATLGGDPLFAELVAIADDGSAAMTAADTGLAPVAFAAVADCVEDFGLAIRPARAT